MNNKTLDDVIVNVKEWEEMQRFKLSEEKVYLYNTVEKKSSHTMYESIFNNYRLIPGCTFEDTQIYGLR